MTGTFVIGEIARLSELVELCQRGSIEHVLPRRILEHLGGLLEADVVEISGLNPVVQVAYLCGPDDGDCHRAFGPDDQTAHPFWRHYWFSERPVFTGLRHQVTMTLADFGGRTVQLTCWRARGPAFDDRCRTQLQLLRPHLERAYNSGNAAPPGAA